MQPFTRRGAQSTPIRAKPKISPVRFVCFIFALQRGRRGAAARLPMLWKCAPNQQVCWVVAVRLPRAINAASERPTWPSVGRRRYGAAALRGRNLLWRQLNLNFCRVLCQTTYCGPFACLLWIVFYFFSLGGGMMRLFENFTKLFLLSDVVGYFLPLLLLLDHHTC